jgi:peptidoglycan/LPS O-acetylase OafA/YrhL
MVLLLEVARGFAALWVFFYHVKGTFINSSEFIYNIASYGHFGVPMFFVISGFVITYSAESTLKASRTPFSFLKKRFLRIYPVFWVSIIVVILLPYLIEFISIFKTGSFHSPENLLLKYNLYEWFNFALLSKVFFAENSNLQSQFNGINAVYWTIAIEFQFYIVIFISLYFKRHYKHVVAAISLLALLNILNPFGINYGVFIHFWPSFSIGILLAYIFKSGYDFSNTIPKKYHRIVSLSIIFIVVFSATTFIEGKPSVLAFAIIFGILLWCTSPIEAFLIKIKNNNKSIAYYILESCIALGAMSYSVYLLHGKLYALPAMFIRQVLEQDTVLYGLIVILSTLLMCYPFYLFVERPFMSGNYVKMHKKSLSE